MSIAPYKTLMKRASDSFIVNKSRFIGHGAPVESEEEALGFLAEMRREYQDASHNCYAYIIGTNMGIMRYNDDGEPGGTAGMPIIEVMKARGVTNAIVVVTRYFGGVLLGTGGLVRAYTQATQAGIEAAELVVELQRWRPIYLVCAPPYPGFGERNPEPWHTLRYWAMHKAHRVKVISPVYHRGVFQERNQFLVDNSSLVIALYDGGPGGTRNTLEYARRKGVPIREL